MPIDPQAQMILDAMAQSDFQLTTEITPQQMRDGMTAGSMMTEVADVAKVENTAIPGPDNNDIPIRVYWPMGCDPDQDVLPGVVFFHGGGWVIGSIDTHDGQVRKLCNGSGAVFVSVDYRLAPEDPFPAGAEDCYAAAVWVAQNGGQFGIDTTKLAVAGDSAGGNLAAVVSQMARDRHGPEFLFQLLVYPVCDMETARWPSMQENKDGPFLTTEIMEWFHAHYLADNEPTEPYISPIRASDLSNLPSALVITAEYDPLRDEGEAYGQALQDAGVEVEIMRVDGMFHGFFGFGEFIDKAKETMDYASAALRDALA